MFGRMYETCGIGYVVMNVTKLPLYHLVPDARMQQRMSPFSFSALLGDNRILAIARANLSLYRRIKGGNESI